jgi:hypothetical protein
VSAELIIRAARGEEIPDFVNVDDLLPECGRIVDEEFLENCPDFEGQWTD